MATSSIEESCHSVFLYYLVYYFVAMKHHLWSPFCRSFSYVWLGVFLVACGGGSRPRPEQGWQREAKFRQLLELSTFVPLDSSRYVLDTLIQFYQDDSMALYQLVEFLTPALSDPNSQVRNEELYIPVLEAVIRSPYYDSVEKIRPQYQLAMARKNRVGQLAADFTYTLAGGRTGRLYAIDAPYTLIYINNPGCAACREIVEAISSSGVITRAITSGKLVVLGIYPDRDLAAWREHARQMPKEWINGYDAQLAIRESELYDLQAIPSMYLLDSDKKVLLKDLTSVPLLEFYLSQR